MCTYSCNRLCEKLNYYSYGHVLVQLIVQRIRNMIVHMRILFITCVLDCMNSCTSDCLYEHPQSDPSSTKCNRVREGVQANHDQDGHDQEVSDLEEGIHLAVGLEGLSARPLAAQVIEGSGYGLVGRI